MLGLMSLNIDLPSRLITILLSSNVTSTLVGIHDSKDLFVKELQALLAQRLLALTKRWYIRGQNTFFDPASQY